MNDGHSYDRETGCCSRCADPWPCLAERQWQRIRDHLEAAARTDSEAADLRHAAANHDYGKAATR